MDKVPANNFARIFWQQQVKAAKINPLMLKWCIYLRHQSQSAYETIRQSKCVILPSQRTLRDYTHHVKSKPEFSGKVDKQLNC